MKMRKAVKPLIFFLVLLLIVALDRVCGFSDLLRGDSLTILQDMVEDHLISAALLYVLITIAGCVLLALPGVTFAMLAVVLMLGHLVKTHHFTQKED